MSTRRAALVHHALAAAAATDASTRRIADIGYDRARIALAMLAADPHVEVLGIEAQPDAADPGRLAWTAAETDLAHGRLTLRTGDALHALAPAEVDGVLIAGLTGPTIATLLSSAPEAVRAALRFAVLCPVRFEATLRPTLAALGWHIADEDLAQERDRFYEIIVARPGPPPRVPPPVDTFADTFGPCLLGARAEPGQWRHEAGQLFPREGPHPLLAAYLADTRRRFVDAFRADLRAYAADHASPERAALRAKLALIPPLLERLQG